MYFNKCDVFIISLVLQFLIDLSIVYFRFFIILYFFCISIFYGLFTFTFPHLRLYNMCMHFCCSLNLRFYITFIFIQRLSSIALFSLNFNFIIIIIVFYKYSNKTGVKLLSLFINLLLFNGNFVF